MTKLYKIFYRLTALLFCLFFVAAGSVSVALATANSSEPIVEPVEKQIRVLIEPGHEPNFGGTVFKGLKERDLTVALGTEIQKLLEQDPHFQVVMTRDTHDWNPIFKDYFKTNWDDIILWEKTTKKTFVDLVTEGIIQKPVSKVSHNTAPTKVATRLFGMNKWANENNFDVTINIHFDDENYHRRNVPGRYSGFAIYQPAPQYDNSERSRELAKDLLDRLVEISRPSTLLKKLGGIIDEPELIAIGANNTSNAASLVVEYGFIYEKKFTDPKLRTKTLQDLALQTYQALDDYRIQKQ